MDVSGVIASLASGTYTVTRTAAAGIVKGRATPGATTTISIVASIQPVTGKDLKRLPEGLRTEDLIAGWTSTELRTAAVAGVYADKITYLGGSYEVQKVESWDETGNYFKFIAMKVGQ